MLETPSLVIDATKMDNNIQRMARVARERTVALRPHVKTHKVPEIAKRQLEHEATGITVAKISEAEVMADGGISDIFVAYPIVAVPQVRRAVELSRRADLILGVDSLQGAGRLSEAAEAEGLVLEVRLEINTGLRRTGVPYDDALEVAHKVQGFDNLSLTGIYTYRGAVLGGSPTLDLEAAGEEEGRLMVSLADRMREQGIGIRDVSVGSTPTAKSAAKVEGVTEIRPGTYVFYDRMQAHLGVCALEDCAATVVTSVVSRPSSDLAVIDGGSKTFATDVQPHNAPLDLEGFGHVVGYPDVVLERFWEEHGTLRVSSEHGFVPGDRVHVIPNHICSTVNLHDEVYLTNEDGTAERLEVAARGRVR